jgi:hypothetical protein
VIHAHDKVTYICLNVFLSSFFHTHFCAQKKTMTEKEKSNALNLKKHSDGIDKFASFLNKDMHSRDDLGISSATDEDSRKWMLYTRENKQIRQVMARFPSKENFYTVRFVMKAKQETRSRSRDSLLTFETPSVVISSCALNAPHRDAIETWKLRNNSHVSYSKDITLDELTRLWEETCACRDVPFEVFKCEEIIYRCLLMGYWPK